MTKLDFEDKYFSINNPKDYKEKLYQTFGKDLIEAQLLFAKQCLQDWVEPAKSYNTRMDNEELKVAMENADKITRWIHSHIVVLAALELGYRVREVSRNRAFPIYLFNVKLKRTKAGA